MPKGRVWFIAVDGVSANDDNTRVAGDRSIAVDGLSANDDITRVAGDRWRPVWCSL